MNAFQPLNEVVRPCETTMTRTNETRPTDFQLRKSFLSFPFLGQIIIEEFKYFQKNSEEKHFFVEWN